MEGLYDCNRCQISYTGGKYDGFNLESGVRQGCPLSPLIFAVCADLLLERLKDKLPTATVRAYADDTAIVVENLDDDLPMISEIFDEYRRLSGLTLNLKKTVIIPLNPEPLAISRQRIHRCCPEWEIVHIDNEGTYLGFQIGPGCEHKSWVEPCKKYEEAVKLWSSVPTGLHGATAAYNVFCLPILTYIAQLQLPSVEALATEERCL